MTGKIGFNTHETAWCPGCGDFGIMAAVKSALEALDKTPQEVLLVGGIGQAAKLPQYLSANGLCTLHGRALPGATGARLANTDLTVVVNSGDGDCYAEGGNHLIHAIRRDVDLTLVVHNNQIYGLTLGQASPTSDVGHETGLQPRGVIARPLRGPALAIALGCRFVARGFSGEVDHLAELIQQGIRHRGFSFIEVLQPCVSMNKSNTSAWYKKRIHELGNHPSYVKDDRPAALARAEQWGDRIPIGILFQADGESFEERIPQLEKGPLVAQSTATKADVAALIEEFL